MDIDNNRDGHNDPQFVKVLETCLKMEIAANQKTFDANTAEIKQLKTTIRSELEKRKELKGKMAQMNKIKLILNETLTKLYISISEVSDTLETIKANVDDQYKLIQLRAQEYQEIIEEYKKTWHEYRAMYERFPLAKARNEAKVNLEKLKIEYMIMSYKKSVIMTIIKQRRHINWIRMRCKIIEFVTVMLERTKLGERLVTLKGSVKHHSNELQSIETELQVLRTKEEDKQRQRKQKILEMAPPKINIPFYEMYTQNQMRAKVHQKQIEEPFDDIISVNTLYLEELCISENAAMSPERMDIDMTYGNDYGNKSPATETVMSDSKSATVSDNDNYNTRPASMALDAEPSAEKATLADIDVDMIETHHDEIQKSQESVKTQPSCRTKENPLKHSIPKNAQNEIEAKRIRLQRQDSKRSINKITTPQPSTIVKEKSLRKSSPRSVPKIKKIETVHYNITPLIPQPIQRSTATASSMFSPTHYEYCDSNMSSLDQDFMSKGASSFCEESLCDYKLSPTSNLSICPEEDVQMTPFSKYTVQQDNKTDKTSNDKTSNDKTSSFDFSDFTKKAKGDYSLFF